MSKPTKSLKTMCKKLGVRLTIKRGQKRVYKSVAVLKKQCAKKKKTKRKRKVKRRRRRRRFGMHITADQRTDPRILKGVTRLQAVARRRYDKEFRAAREKAERKRRMMQYLKYAGVGLGGAGLGALGGYHYRGRRRRFGSYAPKHQSRLDLANENKALNEAFMKEVRQRKIAFPQIQVTPQKLRREYERRSEQKFQKARDTATSAADKRKLMKYLKYAGLGTAGLGALGGGGYAGYRYYKRRGGKKKKGKKKKGKKKK